MELAEVPAHLIVMGGGYAGVEFGQMFRRFGSDVTIVQRGPGLLSHEDEDVAKALADVLAAEGVRVALADVLAAEGVRVALGDVTGPPAFTHVSYDDYRVLRDRLLEADDGPGHTTAERVTPYTVFTDPQLGRVGLTERQARARGRDYALAKIKMASVSCAVETDETEFMMKALVDPGSREILGAAVLAPQGGEIMAILQVAMMSGLPYTALRDGVFTHPSLSEGLNTLFAAVDGPG